MYKILGLSLLLVVFTSGYSSAQNLITSTSKETGEKKVVLIDHLGDDALKPAPPFDEFAKFVKKDSGIKLVYPKG